MLGALATAYPACGKRIGQLAEEVLQRGEQIEVRDATVPTAQTPDAIAAWQRRQRLAQYAVPALAGANIHCAHHAQHRSLAVVHSEVERAGLPARLRRHVGVGPTGQPLLDLLAEGRHRRSSEPARVPWGPARVSMPRPLPSRRLPTNRKPATAPQHLSMALIRPSAAACAKSSLG
ncbi:hypothetical protein AB0I85_30405 [Micromonospora echinofusca]|uniref:hypothetical protein n=1 Tax=Micromonospora echinofusca TaxID=47858 RepID=UPI0034057810